MRHQLAKNPDRWLGEWAILFRPHRNDQRRNFPGAEHNPLQTVAYIPQRTEFRVSRGSLRYLPRAKQIDRTNRAFGLELCNGSIEILGSAPIRTQTNVSVRPTGPAKRHCSALVPVVQQQSGAPAPTAFT
jgi:hypothetical protein